MNVEEAYRVLGLVAPAAAADVKRAYRRKALESHPDRHQDPRQRAHHERLFLQAREAYALLAAEGFPELQAEPPPEIDDGPKVAGRSFAPREGASAPQSETLGLGVSWRVESVAAWGLGLPAAAAILVYFVKAVIETLQGGDP